MYSNLNNFEHEDSFDFRQFLTKYMFHWRYFMISLLVTVSLAIVYIYFYKPEYEIKATLLIQDERKASNEKASLQEIEVNQSSKLVENEIEVLKSRNLILQVVNALELATRYQIKSGYKKRDLYSESPVQLKMLNQLVGDEDVEFEILIKNNKTFILHDAIDKNKEYNFNQDYKNEFGAWKLEAVNNVEDFIGETIKVSVSSPERTANFFQENLEVQMLNEDAPVVSLMVSDELAQRGKDFLNTLIEHYNSASIAAKATKNQSTLNFIDQRLASLSGELNTSEAEVENFRKSRGLTNITSQSEVYLENVQANDTRLNEVNVQLNVIDGIETFLNTSEKAENLPSVVGISDPGLNQLIQQLSQLQNKKAELLATTPENNPVFNPLNRQINATREAIKNNIVNTKLALVNIKQELESFNLKYESSIRSIPSQERQLIGIKRQQTIKEDLYIYLLQKKEELSLSYAATLTDARIIDSAYSGTEKSPKKLIILAIAIMLGLGFPAGLIYAKESLKNTISSQEDVEAITNARILGKVFHHNNKQENNVFVTSPDDKTAETFRTLRTNINFALRSSVDRIILVTSCVSGEGKTFNALNIAASYAQMGKKTILLNFDLRNPNSIIGDTQNSAGLSLFLNDEITMDEIIHGSEFANLDIIHSGPVPSNPLDLMEKEIIKDLFDFLKKNYEYIIIDTPPLAQVSDALTIFKFASLNLIIARCNITKKRLLRVVLSELKNKNINNLSIVLNDNKLISEQMGYGYNKR